MVGYLGILMGFEQCLKSRVVNAPPNNDPNRGLASTAHVKIKEVVFSCGPKSLQWKSDHGIRRFSSSLKTPLGGESGSALMPTKKSQAKSGAALGVGHEFVSFFLRKKSLVPSPSHPG